MSNKEDSLFDATKAASSDLQDPQKEKSASRLEQEEKQILKAWQSMQQHSLCETSAAPGLPQSFLARQRQSSQARRSVPSD